MQGHLAFILLVAALIVGFETVSAFTQQSHSRGYVKTSHSRVYMGKGFGAAPVKKKEFPYTGPLRPGTQGPKLKVPAEIMRPDYAKDGLPKLKFKGNPWDVYPNTPEDIEKMRVAGRIAREVLDEAVRMAKVGVTTQAIDEHVHAETIKRNAYPSPLNYNGFPKSCCTSINEVICHGIPDDRPLQDGDIVNIDITIYHNGVHGDCSETVLLGNVDEKTKDLVITTYEAWQAAINICKPGVRYSEIGGAIEDVVEPKGYTSVREFCGHGVGRIFHTTPNVLHYRNNQRSGTMAPGHTFTIEPMICVKSNKPIFWPDDWTATTADGLPSAQFEHTLLITEDGVEALTGKLPTSPKYSWET